MIPVKLKNSIITPQIYILQGVRPNSSLTFIGTCDTQEVDPGISCSDLHLAQMPELSSPRSYTYNARQ